MIEDNDERDFYKSLTFILIWVLLAAVVAWITAGCSKLTEAFPFPDWKPNDTQPIQQDTTCEDSLYLNPPFVTGWWYIPDNDYDQVQVCAGAFCDTVQLGSSVIPVLDSLLSLYAPSNQYEVYMDGTETIVFIAKGTNNKAHFHGKTWVRPIGFHSGWGFNCNTQALYFFDALTFDQYLTKIDSLPSFDRFTFQYTQWDSLQYIEAFDKILECRIGRTKADLRYLPFTFPDSVYQKFEDAGWDQVLY